MRWYRGVAGLVALLFVFGPALLYVTGERPSAFENRPLAEAPDPADGWGALDALAPWASDHLPGRENAVRANAWVDYHLLGTLPAAAGGARATGAGAAGATAPTPQVLRGRDDTLYLGQEFDLACADRGGYRRALVKLARLARLIESSGRRSLFFVGPNKSAVVGANLPRHLPTGSCAADALPAQDRTLDRFSDPRYVAMRAPLADMVAAGEQPFWRTDTHWSSVGTAVLARRLAERLDPALAARLEVRKGQRSKTGDLTLLAGLDFDEEAASADVSAGGEVRESAGSDHWDEGTPVYGTHRWTTAPSAGLVPGRTALVGDSFTYFALGNLRPLFAEGEFLWIAHPVAQAQIVAGIVDADTVVLETVQRSLTRSLLVSDTFYLAVKKALAADVSPD